MDYNSIITDLDHKKYLYTRRHGLIPNIIVMSKDVWDFIKDYIDNYVTFIISDKSKRQIFGMDVCVIENGLVGFYKIGYIDLD